jgi:peptide/nickel transport system ATP-binding protein
LLEIQNLQVEYPTPDRDVRAVDNVSFSVQPGEIVGLAGESGCGKSTTAHAILRILRPPAEITGGRVLFQGTDLVPLDREALRRYRWRHISLVFQSVMNALNPVMRIGDQFVDMIQAHEHVEKDKALARAGDLLKLVGIDPTRLQAFPHELSGGMRQRVVIAMALALEPELIIMDEPTTALDVVVQRQILQEIQDLQKRLGFAVLFITHDLSLLIEFSNRIAIMYAGEIIEMAASETLFRHPKHPYTVGLMSSFPPLLGERRIMRGIPGSPPNLANPPSGCRFHPRCPHCTREDQALYDVQTKVRPRLREVDPGHLVACHLYADEFRGKYGEVVGGQAAETLAASTARGGQSQTESEARPTQPVGGRTS